MLRSPSCIIVVDQAVIFLTIGMIRFFTFLAEFASQALRYNPQKRVGKMIVRYAHLDQANNRLCSPVGMQVC